MDDRPNVAQDMADRLGPLVAQFIKDSNGAYIEHADGYAIYRFIDGSEIGVSILSRSWQFRQQLAAQRGGEQG